MAARMALMRIAPVALVVLLAPTVARAAERVGIVVQGQKASEIAQAVSEAVGGRFVAVSPVRLSAAESAALWDGARTRGALTGSLERALKAQDLRAVVLVSVTASSKTALRAEVAVVDVSGGATQTARVPAGKIVRRAWRLDLRELTAKVRQQLGKLRGTEARPRSEDTEEVEEIEMVEAVEPVEATEVRATRTRPGRQEGKRDADANVVARVGAGLGMRTFRYAQPLSEGLREYTLGGRLVYRAAVNAYPLIWRGANSYARSLGIEVEYFGTPTFSSRVGSTQDRLETRWHEWRVGPALRLELTPFVLTLSLTYGGLTFDFTSTDAVLVEQLPAMNYRSLRLWSEVEVQTLGWLFLHGGFGLRLLGATGDIVERRFPNAEQAALDVMVGASLPLTSGLRAQAQLAYTHVYFDFKSQPGDLRVAGGALDLYLAFSVGASYAF